MPEKTRVPRSGSLPFWGFPGSPRRKAVPKFLETLRRADLVIAKGQGNFESLCDEDLLFFPAPGQM